MDDRIRDLYETYPGSGRYRGTRHLTRQIVRGLVPTTSREIWEQLVDDQVIYDLLDHNAFPQTFTRSSTADGYLGETLAVDELAIRHTTLFPGRQVHEVFLGPAASHNNTAADNLTIDVSGLPGGGIGDVGGLWIRNWSNWTDNPVVGSSPRFVAAANNANDYQRLIMGPYSTSDNELGPFRSNGSTTKHARFVDATLWADAAKQYVTGMEWEAGGSFKSYLGCALKTTTGGLPAPLDRVTSIAICRDGANTTVTPSSVCIMYATRALVPAECAALSDVLGHLAPADKGSL